MRTGALLYFLAIFTAAASTDAAAQGYPGKPIRLIVPFATGGQSDIVARLLAIKLGEALRQSVIVDNRPGGSGTIGTEMAVRANPDGHTLIMVSAAYAASAALYKLPYDPVNDVATVALIGDSGFMVTLHPSVPAANIKELIAHDRAYPGKLNYGSGGTGGSNHLVTELFNQMAGTRMTHVPYKGGGPAVIDLLGGQIQVFIGTMSAMIPQLKTNRVRAIAVTTAQRARAVPDLPTVGETVTGYEAVTWSAVLGPKAIPQAIVTRLNQEIERILQTREMKERLTGDGMEIVGGSPEKFRDILRRDVAKWQKVVVTGKIKAAD